jgi:hypothetical protein
VRALVTAATAAGDIGKITLPSHSPPPAPTTEHLPTAHDALFACVGSNPRKQYWFTQDEAVAVFIQRPSLRQ